MRTDRRLSIAIVAAVLLLAGCTTTPTRPDHETAALPTPTAATTTKPPPQSSAGAPTPQAAVSALAASFGEFASTIPATIGIAIAPVGGTTMTTFGGWTAGVAWSTIKVPLSIAALRLNRSTAEPLVTRAIARSDNAAAEELWSQLGSPEQAAHQVQAVLREGGDATTLVESRRLRPGFTAFGQTRWPLGRQAQFAARLPCLADAGNVIDLMHNLAEGQRWGLAAGGAAAKGGWGPGQSGGYLVRQFGIVSTAAGKLGVALAAEPDAGTFDAGVGALNRMTEWLTTHAAELPGGSCRE